MAGTSKTLVLITGGNAGIGYEIVKKLAAEQPSYHVLMGTRDIKRGEDACSKLGNPKNVEPIQLDVRSDASIDTCFDTIQQKFGGRLDILINNAGTGGKDMGEKRSSASVREVYNHVYEVNVIGMAVLTEKMIPLLKKVRKPPLPSFSPFPPPSLTIQPSPLTPESSTSPLASAASSYSRAGSSSSCPPRSTAPAKPP